MNIAYREIRILSKEVDEPEIHKIYVNKAIAPGGYWWFFPYSLTPGKVNVGLGVQGGMNYPHPKELLYRHVLSRPEFRGSKVIEAGGATVPTRRPILSLVWNGIGVVGDAAYAVNPIHGGGKGSAMISSYCLARSLIKGLNYGDLSNEMLWDANICYLKMYGIKQGILDIFRIFLQKLNNEDLEYGMKSRLIREEDLNILSMKGDLELSVVEKAMRLLAGLRRPTLLLKLRIVAKFMEKIKKHYINYPSNPKEIIKWARELSLLYDEYVQKIESKR